MKQTRLIASLFLILGLVLAGCGGGQPQEAEMAEEPAMEEEAASDDDAMADEGMMGDFTGQVLSSITRSPITKRRQGNEITSFQQSPMLDAMQWPTARLPPVEERLAG